MTHSQIAVIKGDGIGIDVTNAALAVVEATREVIGGFSLEYREILAGASYFNDQGIDIEPGGEQAAGDCDAIFLGAIGLRRSVTRTVRKFPRTCACAISTGSMPGYDRSRLTLTYRYHWPIRVPRQSTW